jgi:uncharacterized protein
MITFSQIIVFGSAFLAGGLNAIAGGGSFISFPALIFIGISPISANATSTVALLPGSIASVVAYRRQINWKERRFLVLGGISLVGGILGSILLLNTPPSLFGRLLPYLLLVSTLLFAFSKSITNWLARNQILFSKSGMAVLQMAIAIYGGFFGGGIGILMLALLSVMGMENINKMNGVKLVLGATINGMAIIPFAIGGIIAWEQACLMAVGSGLGGYIGAYYAQKLNPVYIRRFVIAIGFAMTAYFFIKDFS